MKHSRFLVMLLVAASLSISACDLNGGGGTTPDPFDSADTPGEQVKVTAGGVQFNMNYANNQASITIPTGPFDNDTAEITTKFFMSETQVTYELWKEVYDWAVHADRGANVYEFQNPGRMGSVDGGAGMTDQHPVTMVSWRDAIIWCNALSEMTGEEVVYVANGTNGTTEGDVLRSSADDAYGTGIDVDDVVKTEADNLTRKGYRLLTSMEWEYAARYRGSDSTNTVSGYSNPYYTKGNSASGATTYYNDNTGGSGEPGKSANDAVAVYRNYWNGSSWVERAEYSGGTEEVGGLLANTLGLYDMSGNVWEWCFTNPSGSYRVRRGGSWSLNADVLRVGYEDNLEPVNRGANIGFRFARTQ